MVTLFRNTDGTHNKSDANSADKWNFRRICTDMNGMRSLPHGASHGEWKAYAHRRVSYTVTSRELVRQVPNKQ